MIILYKAYVSKTQGQQVQSDVQQMFNTNLFHVHIKCDSNFLGKKSDYALI